MKYILLVMMFLFPTVSKAHEELENIKDQKVPNDAIIRVYTKDGKKIGEMSRKDYKVVKVGTSCPKTVCPSCEPVATEKPYNHDDIVAMFKAKQKKNRINYILGAAPQMETSRRADSVRITHPYQPMVGFMYSRMLNEEASVGFGATSSKNLFLTIGTDFK